jgi:hypothetical protein
MDTDDSDEGENIDPRVQTDIIVRCNDLTSPSGYGSTVNPLRVPMGEMSISPKSLLDSSWPDGLFPYRPDGPSRVP